LIEKGTPQHILLESLDALHLSWLGKEGQHDGLRRWLVSDTESGSDELEERTGFVLGKGVLATGNECVRPEERRRRRLLDCKRSVRG